MMYNILLIGLTVIFSFLSLGLNNSNDITDLRVPITVIGAAILVFGRQLVDALLGRGKEDRVERKEMLKALSSLYNKVDTLLLSREKDSDSLEKIKMDMVRVEIRLEHEIGKLYTAIASNKFERKDTNDKA